MKKVVLSLLLFASAHFLIAQPANDDTCSPTMLTIGNDCSATLPYDNTGATAQLGEPIGSCYGDSSVEQTVWFAFVAPSSGAVSIDTDFFGSGMQDNQIAIFELQGGDCTILSNYIEIACNEDRMPNPVNSDFNAAIPPIPVIPGQTYYIQVDGYFDPEFGYTSEGSFCILVTEEFAPLNDDCSNPDIYGGFGPNCTKIWGIDPNHNTTTIGATAGNGIDVFSCDGSEFNATVYYNFVSGVSEVEFNLLSGENINVSLLTDAADCDAGGGAGSIEVTGNCFTNVDASDLADPMDPDILFTNLTPMTSYLMAIWTDEGEATDFEFCLTRAPVYDCGDDECYELAESYTDCPEDCPCLSSINLYNYTTGSNTNTPRAVCPEIVGDLTDPNNPGLYVPFSIDTDDGNLGGSLVTSSVGTLFTSTFPPTPLPNSEATNFLTYLFLTEAELTAGGSITISFSSDAGACDASVTFDIADIIGPDTSECGDCDLNVVPDYDNAFCNGTSVLLNLTLENAIGPLVWISQDNNTSFSDGDFLIALDGSTAVNFFPSDGTYTFYDEGNPNCAVRITFTLGDFTCSSDSACVNPDGGIATVCRLDPTIGDQEVTCNPDGTLNVPIDIGSPTGEVTIDPIEVISGSGTIADPYTTTVDLNNCQPIDFTISDESTCNETPIVTINSPASIAGGITVSTNADDWGVQIPEELGICGTDSAVEGTVAIINDGDTAGGQLTDFCEPTPPEVPDQSVCDQIVGQIAIIDRGQCNFTQKIENAQNCGAIGVIICNCQPGPGWCSADADELLTMGSSGPLENPIVIPAVFMLYADCQEIKAELNNGNDVQICIGAPEIISGCSKEFTVDVCDDYPADFCDDVNPVCPASAKINEFHYDNDGPDMNEFVEIILPVGADPTQVQVDLYNGNGGISYSNIVLSNNEFISTDGAFDYYVWSISIQNGGPDGIAVSCIDGTQYQFISYEGAFMATDGSFAGIMSIDIGVSEDQNNTDSQSIMCDGTGTYFVNCTADPGFANDTNTCGNPDISGCTDPTACNYNPNANIDDGSCVAPGASCDDGDCGTENDMIGGNCECTGIPIQCPPDETFNLLTCMCEEVGPCLEDISGSVTSPDPLCDLSGINIIITAPDGTSIIVTTDANGNFTVPGGPYPCGTYTATFENEVLLPVCYTDTGSTEPLTFEVDGNPNTDDGPKFIANPAIPTLSQWGLIVLALLLMIFGALTLSSSTLQTYRFTTK